MGLNYRKLFISARFVLIIRLQVYCIFLFLSAASLFGTIIAQVNEIVASLTMKKKDLDSILEVYLGVHPK